MGAIVIGGGPAGLTAANLLADRGVGVTVLEARSRPGGRAASDRVDGFVLNQGPHALYLGGAGRRVLGALGIDPPGWRPRLDGAVAVREGVPAHVLGRALGLRSKAAYVRWVTAALRTDPAAVAGVSAEAWLESAITDDRAREAALAHVRTATYCDRLDRLSADAAVLQARLVLAPGVRYVRGGWQAIVDALAARATALGVEIRCGAAARALEADGDGWAVELDAERLHAPVVVLAGGTPEREARLVAGLRGQTPPSAGLRGQTPPSAGLGGQTPPSAGLGGQTPPSAVASTLDVGVERLPRSRRRFAVGFDAPRYLSVHSAPGARPVLISVASYGRAGREDLEAFAEAVQPGCLEGAIMTRHLPRMVTIGAIPTPEHGGLAGRAAVAVDGAPGLLRAGDWVGPDGMLLDAALASAARAAELAAPLATGRPRVAQAA